MRRGATKARGRGRHMFEVGIKRIRQSMDSNRAMQPRHSVLNRIRSARASAPSDPSRHGGSPDTLSAQVQCLITRDALRQTGLRGGEEGGLPLSGMTTTSAYRRVAAVSYLWLGNSVESMIRGGVPTAWTDAQTFSVCEPFPFCSCFPGPGLGSRKAHPKLGAASRLLQRAQLAKPSCRHAALRFRLLIVIAVRAVTREESAERRGCRCRCGRRRRRRCRHWRRQRGRVVIRDDFLPLDDPGNER